METPSSYMVCRRIFAPRLANVTSDLYVCILIRPLPFRGTGFNVTYTTVLDLSIVYYIWVTLS